MINLIKVILIFVCIFALMIPLSFLVQSSKNEKVLRSYSDSNIRDVCVQSPAPIYFQECFKKELVKVMSSYTPNDALKIMRTINNVYDLDKHHSKEEAQLLYNQLLYFENWIIFIENAKNMGVARDDASFLDIVIIPYVKYVAHDEVQKVLELYRNSKRVPMKVESNSQMKSRWERVDKKLLSIKL